MEERNLTEENVAVSFIKAYELNVRLFQKFNKRYHSACHCC